MPDLEADAMLPHWLMAILMMLTDAWSARRDTRLRFLKLQIELLRAKLPGDRASCLQRIGRGCFGWVGR